MPDSCAYFRGHMAPMAYTKREPRPPLHGLPQLTFLGEGNNLPVEEQRRA
jgi:hypothetical protein